LQQAVQDIKNPKSSNNWVILGYDKQTPKIKVVKTGAGGFVEMSEELNDAKVLFAFVRFTIRGVNKFLYVAWCGEGAPVALKGRFGGHSKDLERVFVGFHVSVNARSEKDVEEKVILAKLDKAMGANFDAGQKEQGQKKGGVANISEGIQKVTNPKQKEVKKIDQGTGLQDRGDFWKNQEAEPAANAGKGYVPVREDPSYKLTQEREKFWASNPEPQAGSQASASNAVPQPTPEGARNLKNKFEQQAVAAAAPPPPRAAPPRKPVAVLQPPPPEPEPQPEPQPEPVQEAHHQEQEQEQQEHHEQPVEPQHEEQHPDAMAQTTPEQPPVPAAAPATGNIIGQARAQFDYAGEAEGDLRFNAGDIINILDESDPSGWWQGELNGAVGVFPCNFVQRI